MKLTGYSILFVLAGLISCSPEKIPVLVHTSNKTNTIPLKDILFINDSVGYAAGGLGYQSGIILSTHDAGQSWHVDSTFIPAILSLTKWGDSMVIGVGYSGNLLINKYDKGWLGKRLFNWSEFKEIAVTHEQDMYIAIGSSFHIGQILHVTKEFNIDTIYDFDNEIKSIVCLNKNELVGAGYGVVVNSHDNGKSWIRNSQEGDYYQKLEFTDDKTGYAIGFAGSIIKTLDGGNSWKELVSSKSHSFGSDAFLDIACKDDNSIYVCGEEGTLWKSSDGGNFWQQFDVFTSDHLTGISVRGNIIWLSSSSGKIYKVID